MHAPEDLMRKLRGSRYFSKIDLADSFNQIKLAPVSQRMLALTTNRGVLLHARLPFGVISIPGYFQEIMDKLNCGQKGVAVYLDDILVGGANFMEPLENLEALLHRIRDKGLRWIQKKYKSANDSIEYLGLVISKGVVWKGKLELMSL